MVGGGKRRSPSTMLLEEVLSQAADAPGLLLRPGLDAADGRASLVRDVLAAANAAALPLRHVLYGAEPLAGRVHVRGLERDDVERFRQLTRGLADLIAPALQITPILVESNGRILAALQISGCNNPPYTLCRRVDEHLRTGACWVQAEGELRPARREDLEEIHARHALTLSVPIQVGLNSDAGCDQIQLTVPDTSQAPSETVRGRLMAAIDAKKAAAGVLGNDDTGLARLAHARIFGPDEPFVLHGVGTLVQRFNNVTDECEAADQHYYFEQQGVKLNFTLRNNESFALDDIEVQLSLPQAQGLQVADRLYLDAAGGKTIMESRLAGYPQVEKGAGRALVTVQVGTLPAGEQQSLCESALRLHVGPEMRGMKVAIKYKVTARGLAEPARGRLKLYFRR